MVDAGMSDGQEAALHRGLELAAEALIRFGIACWKVVLTSSNAAIRWRRAT